MNKVSTEVSASGQGNSSSTEEPCQGSPVAWKPPSAQARELAPQHRCCSCSNLTAGAHTQHRHTHTYTHISTHSPTHPHTHTHTHTHIHAPTHTPTHTHPRTVTTFKHSYTRSHARMRKHTQPLGFRDAEIHYSQNQEFEPNRRARFDTNQRATAQFRVITFWPQRVHAGRFCQQGSRQVQHPPQDPSLFGHCRTQSYNHRPSDWRRRANQIAPISSILLGVNHFQPYLTYFLYHSVLQLECL